MSKCRENKARLRSQRAMAIKNGTYNKYESYEQGLINRSKSMTDKYKDLMAMESTTRRNEHGYCEHYYRTY